MLDDVAKDYAHGKSACSLVFRYDPVHVAVFMR